MTWNRAIRVWWSYVCARSSGIIVSGVIGFIPAIVGTIIGLPLPALQVIGGVLGLVIGLASSVGPIKLSGRWGVCHDYDQGKHVRRRRRDLGHVSCRHRRR